MNSDNFAVKYGFSILLIFMHFCGDLINYIAIIISSIYISYYYISKSKIDLFTLFLLLIPSIIFKDKLEFNDLDLNYISFLPKILN